MPNMISKHALAAVLAFVAASSTGACATEDNDTDMPDMVWVDATEVVSTHGTRSTELVGLGMGEQPLVVDSSACACTTAACVDGFVRENIGCDVCVAFACADGGFVGGCVRCDP